ncbi:zinc finger BED domain-containing protein RICESLEEPER 2-like [Dorcoceras hygrometricum]|uniref:Zinc finger BED domain-containing protein RICESLEEPER 2-like n=1 Tax=Dorcoceras hygrometricum TaxID=472368 RepID=A0A2Z7AP77_9LAMI|nr:zinc finger BED domain-containing protein RICESLEEPER 2-like [Dorcoceras hygrometricum]
MVDSNVAPIVFAPSASNDASERFENQNNEPESQDHMEEVDPNPFAPKKKHKKSSVWEEFKEIDVNGGMKAECIHCKARLTISKSRQTTSFRRHLDTSEVRRTRQRNAQQTTMLNYQPVSNSYFQPPLISSKFDMGRMREAAAHWILMHEHPFTILEEEGLNMMLKLGTGKADCVAVYEQEKKNEPKIKEIALQIT